MGGSGGPVRVQAPTPAHAEPAPADPAAPAADAPSSQAADEDAGEERVPKVADVSGGASVEISLDWD
ncbi:MAG TPA: hypothetical protein VLA59_05030, partial [Patescibacteria group bacterium]|nr:hypothetical protein [Patescibacteria group bacterium]